MRGVDYVFHAAALKQVPSCEFFPLEAVKTNVLGTENMLNAAIACNVKKVICLSTDKAVYPVNAMGTSKAMMEKVVVAKARSIAEESTVICCTRYGNVLCSRGSVVPLWIDQIRSGLSVTVTNGEMTRFIMSLDEAVDLVLFAFEHGESGDILVQKAPACTIRTQVEAVCELFGCDKSRIKVIGIRHGEKMYETIVNRGGEGKTGLACMSGCLIKCSNIYPDAAGKKICSTLQYENIALLGSNLGFTDLDPVARLNHECDDIGLDAIEALFQDIRRDRDESYRALEARFSGARRAGDAS